jgi:CTP synthase (UTP-ammonia lyase)
VPIESVISNPDVSSIYQVPQVLYDEGVFKPVAAHLGIKSKKPDLTAWKAVASRFVDFDR